MTSTSWSICSEHVQRWWAALPDIAVSQWGPLQTSTAAVRSGSSAHATSYWFHYRRRSSPPPSPPPFFFPFLFLFSPFFGTAMCPRCVTLPEGVAIHPVGEEITIAGMYDRISAGPHEIARDVVSFSVQSGRSYSAGSYSSRLNELRLFVTLWEKAITYLSK